jgi:hypothetical protein
MTTMTVTFTGDVVNRARREVFHGGTTVGRILGKAD